ncbi:hypothetical protein NQ318_021672 [Aromia moschata]|uniref:Uncharacterized protein n=1 Tax=Aromia moschata TaxID=1265417 RepID=A0AAV8YE53_9CUCU|nr:hypothetical protein NQ318_021672 [Aromia moschata]
MYSTTLLSIIITHAVVMIAQLQCAFKCQGYTLTLKRALPWERFPNRRLPNHTTFTPVVRRLRETGRFAARSADYGRNRFARTADVEEEILARVEADPELSTRRIGAEMEISKDVVHRTLTYGTVTSSIS